MATQPRSRNGGNNDVPPWLEHYDKEQGALREQVGDLTKNVAALTADVRTLVDNQRGMFSRINRPPQWGVLVALGTLIVLAGGLVIAPLKEDIAHIQTVRQAEKERTDQILFMFNDEQKNDLYHRGKTDEALDWLKRTDTQSYETHKQLNDTINMLIRDHMCPAGQEECHARG